MTISEVLLVKMPFLDSQQGVPDVLTPTSLRLEQAPFNLAPSLNPQIGSSVWGFALSTRNLTPLEAPNSKSLHVQLPHLHWHDDLLNRTQVRT